MSKSSVMKQTMHHEFNFHHSVYCQVVKVSRKYCNLLIESDLIKTSNKCDKDFTSNTESFSKIVLFSQNIFCIFCIEKISSLGLGELYLGGAKKSSLR